MKKNSCILLISLVFLTLAFPGKSQSDVTTNNIYFPASGNAADGKPNARLVETFGVRFNSPHSRWVFASNTAILVGYAAAGESWGDGNLLASGKIGIGTKTPREKLEINGNLRFAEYDQHIGWGASNTQTFIDEDFGVQLNGDSTHPIQVLSTALMVGYDQTTLKTRNAGDLFISGKMSIGTDTPSDNHELDVVGSIRSQEVVVEIASGSGPDYVFEEDYELRTLKDTEAYIQENKHLPEIPPASEMEEKGIALSEMNMKLLKKIEELTLHLIEQNKEIERLRIRLDAVETAK